MRCKVITIGMIWVFLFSGCAAIQREKIPAESIFPELKWSLENYAAFVKENMTEINSRYSLEYGPYEFVVETEYGSTVVQNLIDTESVSAIAADWSKYSNPGNPDKWAAIYQYLIEEYEYILDPRAWHPVEETIRTKQGDCKSLSLLLMSLLLSAGYDTYAGIANGHMWVAVNGNNQWHILELDQDPERSTIYGIPGFYEDPLYKIHSDRSEKRKRIK